MASVLGESECGRKGLEFDLTTYAVDTTTSEFRGEEDRRFALSLSFGL